MDNNFSDQHNVAVITTKKILDKLAWIGYVTHDKDDGGWQFLENKDSKPDVEDAALASMNNIINIDNSIGQLSDLPIGWHACREAKDSPCIKEEIN